MMAGNEDSTNGVTGSSETTRSEPISTSFSLMTLTGASASAHKWDRQFLNESLRQATVQNISSHYSGLHLIAKSMGQVLDSDLLNQLIISMGFSGLQQLRQSFRHDTVKVLRPEEYFSFLRSDSKPRALVAAFLENIGIVLRADGLGPKAARPRSDDASTQSLPKQSRKNVNLNPFYQPNDGAEYGFATEAESSMVELAVDTIDIAPFTRFASLAGPQTVVVKRTVRAGFEELTIASRPYSRTGKISNGPWILITASRLVSSRDFTSIKCSCPESTCSASRAAAAANSFSAAAATERTVVDVEESDECFHAL